MFWPQNSKTCPAASTNSGLGHVISGDNLNQVEETSHPKRSRTSLSISEPMPTGTVQSKMNAVAKWSAAREDFMLIKVRRPCLLMTA